MAPAYLRELLQWYKAPRSLRSNALAKLVVPKTRLKNYGDRAFVKAAPCLWNGLPLSLRQISDVDEFKSALKTHLYRVAYGWTSWLQWIKPMSCCNACMDYLYYVLSQLLSFKNLCSFFYLYIFTMQFCLIIISNFCVSYCVWYVQMQCAFYYIIICLILYVVKRLEHLTW